MHIPRIVVIGVGQFGRNHARHLAALSQTKAVDLLGVVDANLAQANMVAAELGIGSYSEVDGILHRVDAAVIAVPTVYHLATARPFLQLGIPVFIEKPIAATLDQADELVELARQANTFIQVGHIERFNPTWRQLSELELNPQFMECQRWSPYPFRSIDIDVVLDLMIHDLDLVLTAIKSSVVRVTAAARTVVSPTADQVEAELIFAGGQVARLSTSRVASYPKRSIRMWDQRRTIEADFLNRVIVENTATSGAAWSTAMGTPADAEAKQAIWSQMVTQKRWDVAQKDALREELMQFIDCVRGVRTPEVDAHAARQSLATALRISAASQPNLNNMRRAA